VGVSVAGAVDVAREAADVVLLEPGLGVLHAGILEGRRSFGNVLKYILMGTSSNFGNMLSMAGAALFLPFLPMLPTQILLNNFLYDLAQLAIPTDSVDAAYLDRPQRWDIGRVRRFMLIIGPISSLYDFLTFWILLSVFHASETLFHTGWFLESLATQVLVVFVIRTAGRFWRSRPSIALTVDVVAVLVFALALPWTPLGAFLGFQPLPMSYFLFLVCATLTYLGLVEVAKSRLLPRFETGRLGARRAEPAPSSSPPHLVRRGPAPPR
jgi:Mg2+-importing ATPase